MRDPVIRSSLHSLVFGSAVHQTRRPRHWKVGLCCVPLRFVLSTVSSVSDVFLVHVFCQVGCSAHIGTAMWRAWRRMRLTVLRSPFSILMTVTINLSLPLATSQVCCVCSAAVYITDVCVFISPSQSPFTSSFHHLGIFGPCMIVARCASGLTFSLFS